MGGLNGKSVITIKKKYFSPPIGGVRGSGYSPRITNMMLEVNNFTKIVDSMRIRIVNQSYPPNKYFGPPIRGVRGVGGTSYWHPY